MDYHNFVCPDHVRSQDRLQMRGSYLECTACKKRYPIRDSVPLLFPSKGVEAAINGRKYSLEEVQDIYNRAYDCDGLMGTDLDDQYDRVTKCALLNCGQPLNGKRLLDLGTGVGNLWRYAPHDIFGYAIDISYIGAEKALRRRSDLTVAAAVGEYLPFPAGFFDLVIAADTLEHTFNPEATLAEVKRVLKPAGILGLSVPAPDSLRKWGWNQLRSRRFELRFLFRLALILVRRMRLFGKTEFQPIDRDLNCSEWIALVESAGFKIGEVIEWPEPPRLPIVFLLCAEQV